MERIALPAMALLLLLAAGCGTGDDSRETGRIERTGETELQNLTGMPLELRDVSMISFYARDLGAPRDMIFDSRGTLLVSATRQGSVLALPDRNSDGESDDRVVVVDGLNRPHGLALDPSDEGRLYVAETDQVAVYDYDPETMKASGKLKLVDLPSGGGHFTRSILFMPPPDQERLLISVGSSCNVCHEDDSRRAAIMATGKDGSGTGIFASGLRNSVFMAIHPVTEEIWATEMGRDRLGDDLPPDEINIVREGHDYGWPLCYGKNVQDEEFDSTPVSGDPCQGKSPSHIDIPAHSAPLGLAFFPGNGWPEGYENDLAVALHGFWNRSIPTGYKVVRYRLDASGNYVGEEEMITGWLRPGGDYLGRPADILFKEDGTMFVSDDYAGVIYRVVPAGD